jgi:hypothetical protein
MVAMSALANAIHGLELAVDGPRRQHLWRWLVRHRMSAVKDALMTETAPGAEAWLAPREIVLRHDRAALLRRLTALGPTVLHGEDVDGIHRELTRLVDDLERYCQRVNDLVYDSVALELGGSE